MLILCLHYGARKANREPAPMPTPTRTYLPISHNRLLALIESTLVGADLRIVNEAHALSESCDPGAANASRSTRRSMDLACLSSA